MPIRDSSPVAFVPAGVTDSVDQASSFPGACQLLQNLIFDRVNRGAVVPRPGVVSASSFAGFTSPGVVSVMISVGTLIYGMVATARNVGFDEPFCYDTAAGAFITVSGVTGANVPTTPATTGSWTPPTMDVIGTKVIVTHPGFSGANKIGWFDVSTPSAPAWSAGTTTTNGLPSVPLWVAQFGGRAYYGVGNMVYFSDALAPTAISNTNFAGALTLGDTSNTLAATGLPLSSSSGGIVGSLIVFKLDSVWQIIGDITSALSLNQLADGIGTSMPRSVTSSPMGVYFVATDGPRVVDLSAIVKYIENDNSLVPDVVSPLTKATDASRVCGTYGNSIYRIGFAASFNSWNNTYTSADYWYDVIVGRWNGIHTFPYNAACSIGKTFWMASNTNPGVLFTSDSIPSSTSVYTDNASAFICQVVSAYAEGAPMQVSSIVESTIELSSLTPQDSYFISMYDEQNNPLSIATISLKTVAPLWGTDKFGQFRWATAITTSRAYTIPWVNPIVCSKFALSVVVAASKNVSIKRSMFRVQALGYTNK